MDASASKIYFRHDRIRPYQQQLVDDIHSAVSGGRHLLAHAPTGMGKTDAALSATLGYAIDNGLTVFFLTPKISQHRIAVEVSQGIAKKFGLNIKAVDMIGRRYACVDPTLAGLNHDGFYLSCEKKRRNESCIFYRNAKGYSKADEAKAKALFDRMVADYGTAKLHPEIVKLGEKHLACPYEWMTKLASVSNVVVADYYHLMIPWIRDIFLKKTRKKLEKSIVIIDEAHNLAKRVREQMSSSMNSFIMRRAEKEMKALGAEKMALCDPFDKWSKSQLNGKGEELATKKSFDDFLGAYDMGKEELADYFEAMGIEFVEKANKKSACLALSKFITSWAVEDKGSLRIVRKRGEFHSLSKRFLDPSLVTSELNKAHSAVLMSGTLLPLEMHRDVLGLDEGRSELKSYRSPFEENNTMNIVADTTTTRYSKRDFENYTRIAAGIDRIIGVSPKGVALFFPSYNVMNAVVPLMKSPNLAVQESQMTPYDNARLLQDFVQKGVLCAVQGGSLSEGIDYCNGEIKTAVIVGIALEEPSLEVSALIEYYQEKFGRGWDYGYLYPGIIKALQAAGRGIRKETDRAAIVFMDERFKWKNYRSILETDRKLIITSEPEKYVRFFWSGTK
jgi:DNA excision repair protein ERCC-2